MSDRPSEHVDHSESMIDYESFPGLAGVFLEDCYVLGITESPEQVRGCPSGSRDVSAFIP